MVWCGKWHGLVGSVRSGGVGRVISSLSRRADFWASEARNGIFGTTTHSGGRCSLGAALGARMNACSSKYLKLIAPTPASETCFAKRVFVNAVLAGPSAIDVFESSILTTPLGGLGTFTTTFLEVAQAQPCSVRMCRARSGAVLFQTLTSTPTRTSGGGIRRGPISEQQLVGACTPLESTKNDSGVVALVGVAL